MLKTVSIRQTVTGLENVLKIDHTDSDILRVRDEAVARLESELQVKLSGDIYKDQLINQLIGKSIEIFLAECTKGLADLALLSSLYLLNREAVESLRDKAYLGFPKERIANALRYLQDSTTYVNKDQFIESIYNAASQIDICYVKRLIAIMAVFEKIGLPEGVHVVAQYLYLPIL